MNYLPFVSWGFYGASDGDERSDYYASWGILGDFPFYEFPEAEELFSDGQLLIRLPFSENYILDGTTYFIRLPWSEDYGADSGEQFLRQPFSEDYKQGSDLYKRMPNSENYETDSFMFIRLPFSENYRIVEK